MEYFFRYQEDGYFNIKMTLIRILLVLAIGFAYKNRKSKCLLDITLILGLFLQFLLFYWYFGQKNLFLKEGLPLFHCRIAAIMMAISHFLKKEKWARYFAWLGIIGTIVAFLFPDPSKFVWPHITNITYIGTHLLLMIDGVLIISKRAEIISLQDILQITFIMNMFISLINITIDSNYAYLSKLPISIFEHLSKFIIFILINLIIITLINFLEKELVKYIYDKKISLNN